MHKHIVLAALGLLATTSSALAQDTQEPAAHAHPETAAAPAVQRIFTIGSAVGAQVTGAAPMVLGIDGTYMYRLPSGLELGATATLATNHVFAGIAAETAMALPRNGRMRVGSDFGLHHIDDTFSTFLDASWRIETAPDGVYLPYAGAMMAFEFKARRGAYGGIRLQVRHDLQRERHMLVGEGFLLGGYEEKEAVMGGDTVTLGLYLSLAPH